MACLNTGRNAVVFSAWAKAAKGMTRVASSMNAMRKDFAAPAPVAHLRPVHHVAHRKLAGIAEGKSSPVGGDGLAGARVEQALAREQPVHR